MEADKTEIAKEAPSDRPEGPGEAIEIRHEGRPLGVELSRAAHAYLVIDCSFSMSGDKLAQAKKGAVDFSREAKDKGYTVGIVQFATRATHICEPHEDLSLLQRHVNELKVGGTTNMADGIRLATSKLADRSRARAMVVVTDGQPNDQRAALAAADDAKRRGIDIITIGTDDADRSLLARIASRSDLSTMVTSDALGAGIASSARMLPRGDLGTQGKS